MFYVYLITCRDSSFYVGFTTNIEERIKRHKAGHGAKFTLERKAEEIVYFESFQKESDALKREKQLKGWSHAKKQALVEQKIDRLKKLSVSRQSPRFVTN